MNSKLLTVVSSVAFLSLACVASGSVGVTNANLANNPYLVKLAEKSGTAKLAPRATSSKTANASVSSTGNSSKADSRVREALDRAGVKYIIDNDGDFRVIWNIKDNRMHTTFINSNLARVDTREIWAVAFVAKSIDADNLLALLELNSTYPIGAWEVQKKGNGDYWAVFSVKVPAKASGEILKQVSNLVAKVADEVEAKTTLGDEL